MLHLQSTLPRAPTDVDHHLVEKVGASLRRWVQAARLIFGGEVYLPTVSFDLVGAFAGCAYGDTRTIRLNPVLLAANFEKFDSEIVPHELGHLIVHLLYGEAAPAHGAEWREVMRKLGVEPVRLHSLTAAGATAARVHGYSCGCTKDNWLTARQHTRAQRGSLYSCTSCGGVMLFTGAS